jgi:hypothetical protein
MKVAISTRRALRADQSMIRAFGISREAFAALKLLSVDKGGGGDSLSPRKCPDLDEAVAAHASFTFEAARPVHDDAGRAASLRASGTAISARRYAFDDASAYMLGEDHPGCKPNQTRAVRAPC